MTDVAVLTDVHSHSIGADVATTLLAAFMGVNGFFTRVPSGLHADDAAERR